MKNILRNLWVTITRFKMASVLNIVGLAVAFSVFAIIMMQVVYERGYGKNDPNYREIFRMESQDEFNKGMWMCQISGKVLEYMSTSDPKILAAFYCDSNEDLKMASSDSSTNWVESAMYSVYNDPRKVFQFEMVQGSTDQLLVGTNAIIPQSLAKVLYPDGDAVGKLLHIKGQYYDDAPIQTVIGVYRDFPDNSILKNYVYGKSTRINEKGEMWDANNVFIRAQVTDTATIIKNVAKFKSSTNNYGKDVLDRLTPIGEAYYFNDVSLWGEKNSQGDRNTTNMLFMVSILILFIASINFVNFSTALAPARIKGLNTRLVFGNSRSNLRIMLIGEAVGIAIISYIISLLWLYGFNDTSAAELIQTSSTAIKDNLDVIIGTGVVALIVGFVAGVYPAMYCTRFSPALVLKGSGMGALHGQWIRTILIGFQYVISITLIICSLVIARQNNFLHNASLGFEKNNTFCIPMGMCSHNQREQLATKLQQNPDFKKATYSWGVVGEGFGMRSPIEINGEKVTVNMMPVFHNFLSVFKIPIIAGRNFSETDYKILHPEQAGFYVDTDNDQKMIANKLAAKMYNLKVDSMYGDKRCIGICDNFNTRSLYNDYDPMCFILNSVIGNMYIKYNGNNTKEAYDYIEKTFKELKLPDEFNAKLLTEIFAEQYVKEKNLATLVNLFSGLAIILSLVGVFGLVVFETQYRRREIAIRKLYGSTVTQILEMVNRKFIITTLICAIIATPVAYYAMSYWLSGFAFHTSLAWWSFVVGAAIVLSITILTVTIQAYHSATINPAKAIKSE